MPIRSWEVDEARVREPARLAALRRTGLLDTPQEPAFDRFAKEASSWLGAPTALLTLVDTDRQFFKAHVGLPEPVATTRATPLSHSLCQYAVVHREPVVIDDVSAHPGLAGNGAVTEMGVAAYAGAPLLTREGHVLGALCVIDSRPREWTPAQVKTLTTLAAQVVEEIERR